MTTQTQKLRLEFSHQGTVARLILSAPKANVIDVEMLDELNRSMDVIEERTGLKAIVLTAEGPHFSFGASIEEHLPDAIESTLQHLHTTIRHLNALPAPTIAAVHGQCLGGGLELALACDLILAETNAHLSCPEITLGVIAPAASVLLPLRIRGGDAVHFLLTGASWSAEEALDKGLVDRIAPEGQLAATLDDWLEKDFVSRSSVGLHYASHAVRSPRTRVLENDLPHLERLYLEGLMSSPDGSEGIRAFLEKRTPAWREGVADEF